MKKLLFACVLLLVLNLGSSQTPLGCVQYLSYLSNLYNTSQAEFAKVMAPYLLLSGKILDDMGFPISCLKNPSNAYWEVQVSLTQQEQNAEITMYYGLCFTNQCDAQMLNQQSDLLIDLLFQNMTEIGYEINTIQFFSVDMDVTVTPGTIILSILISFYALSRLAHSFLKWSRLCVTDSEEQALAIEMEEIQEDKEAGRMPQHSLTFIEKYSFSRALGKLFQEEQSNKIMAFSLFKIFSLPFIVFGYLFYLSNYGAYNYFSFNSQIYKTFYAKVATFAYYLPDIFYFISAYVLAKKLLHLDEVDESNKTANIIAAVFRKLIKIYPLYFAVLLIYWIITPSTHAGPLWNVYMDQIDQCNSNWWRSLLMIDNWFTGGCFSYSWYIQLEFQFMLVAAALFAVYSYKRVVALGILYTLLINGLVFVFVFGGKLPTSIQTAISEDAVLYFQAFYSHLFFYLFGIYAAFIMSKLSVRTFVRDQFVANQGVFTGVIVVAFAMIVFIILRPGVWQNALSLELAFCRIGIMISFLLFFLPSMAKDQTNKTKIHKLSNLTYGIILCIGMVTSSGFWGMNFFAYVDGINLLQSSLTYLLISIAVGGSLGVLFDITPFTLAH